MLEIRQGERRDQIMENKEIHTRLDSTSGFVISAGGLIFDIVASRLLGVRNEGLLSRVGEVLTSEAIVLSAKCRAISFSQAKVTYPESAMMNVMNARTEDARMPGQ